MLEFFVNDLGRLRVNDLGRLREKVKVPGACSAHEQSMHPGFISARGNRAVQPADEKVKVPGACSLVSKVRAHLVSTGTKRNYFPQKLYGKSRP